MKKCAICSEEFEARSHHRTCGPICSASLDRATALERHFRINPKRISPCSECQNFFAMKGPSMTCGPYCSKKRSQRVQFERSQRNKQSDLWVKKKKRWDRSYYERNRDKIIQFGKEWKRNNPEKVQESYRNNRTKTIQATKIKKRMSMIATAKMETQIAINHITRN